MNVPSSEGRDWRGPSRSQGCQPSAAIYAIVGVVGAVVLVGVAATVVFMRRRAAPKATKSEKAPLIPESQVADTSPGLVYSGL